MFLTQFIYAAIEMPSKVTVYFLLHVIGRRTCLAGSLLLSGICIATNIFVPKGLAESSVAEAHDDLFYYVVSDFKDAKYFPSRKGTLVITSIMCFLIFGHPHPFHLALSLHFLCLRLGLGCHRSCTDKVLVCWGQMALKAKVYEIFPRMPSQSTATATKCNYFSLNRDF